MNEQQGDSGISAAVREPTPKAYGWLPLLPEKTLELIAVLLLSIASLGAAWAGYQASRWGGEQSTFYSKASAVRVESTRASTIGYMLALGDLTVFNAWAEATAEENQDLVDFHRRRFSPELEIAVTAWLAMDPLNDPDAPGGPFEAGLYSNADMLEAEHLEDEAAETFEQGRLANRHSDNFVLLTVIFAMVLFFSGISGRINAYLPKLLVLSIATLLLVYVAGRMLLLPMM